jgi:AcrR family transcriptional regulator
MSYDSGVDVKHDRAGDPGKRAARTLILRAAERLFAERGIEHVSLREIGTAAGQRNNSAVQYHFGTREHLVRALYEERLAPLDRRRRELLAALGPHAADDLPGLVRAYLTPLAEAVRDAPEPTWYARFVQRFALGGHVVHPPLPEALVAGLRTGLDLIDTHLTRRGLPAPIRAERSRLFTAALADAERRVAVGESVAFDPLIDHLTAASVGLLTAPSSA